MPSHYIFSPGAIRHIGYHWLWGLTTNIHYAYAVRSISDRVNGFIENESSLLHESITKYQNTVTVINQKPKWLRALYWFFNINNYCFYTYCLEAHASVRLYNVIKQQIIKIDPSEEQDFFTHRCFTVDTQNDLWDIEEIKDLKERAILFSNRLTQRKDWPKFSSELGIKNFERLLFWLKHKRYPEQPEEEEKPEPTPSEKAKACLLELIKIYADPQKRRKHWEEEQKRWQKENDKFRDTNPYQWETPIKDNVLKSMILLLSTIEANLEEKTEQQVNYRIPLPDGSEVLVNEHLAKILLYQHLEMELLGIYRRFNTPELYSPSNTATSFHEKISSYRGHFFKQEPTNIEGSAALMIKLCTH